MTDVVNLNRFRKKKARAGKEKRSEENRAKFGRTKAEKQKTQAEGAKLARHLDGHTADDSGEGA